MKGPYPSPTAKHKKYHRMGEVTEMTGLEPHVIRFWEGEFPMLSPRKTSSGHRTYTREDIDLIFKIKRLVHDEGYTLAGARKKLEGKETLDTPEENTRTTRLLGEIREVKSLLENVLNMLDRE